MRTRRVLGVAVSFLTLFIVAIAYAVTQTANDGPKITVTARQTDSGAVAVQDIHGTGFPPDQDVVLFVDDRIVTSVHADARGELSYTDNQLLTAGSHQYLAVGPAGKYALGIAHVPGESYAHLQGITVGEPKIFDERDLRQRVSDIQASLAAGQYVSPTAAINALGRLQGGTSESTWFQASLSGPPGLGSQSTVSQVTNSTAAPATTTNPPSPTTTQTTATTMTYPTITPTGTTAMPTLSNLPFSSPTQTSVGLGPFETLAQQTELAFEAYNISTLLSGSLSDKIEFSRADDGTTTYRPQAVVGFGVTVVPPDNCLDAVAEVVVTIRSSGSVDPPSLRELLPRAKTYNVASIRQGSQALGIGSVAKLISVNVSGGRTNQNLYLVQDVDTVALEHLSPDEYEGKPRRSLQFGWQFRPVLDQHSVLPGQRQVFAVLSLPSTEEKAWEGIVNVQTFWRSYNPKTRLAGPIRLLPAQTTQSYVLRIPSIKEQHQAVSAKIDDISWNAPVPIDRAVVTAVGHIPRGVRVVVGDSVIDTTNGLIVQTEQRVTFSVPLRKLAFDDAELIDAFGVATKLIRPANSDSCPIKIAESGKAFTVCRVKATVNGGDTTLSIYLRPDKKNGGCDALDCLLQKRRPILVRTGEKVYGLLASDVTWMPQPNWPRSETDSCDRDTTKIVADDLRQLDVIVPTEAFLREPAVFVYVPFLGDSYRADGSPALTDYESEIFTATAAKVLASQGTTSVGNDGKIDDQRTVRLGIIGTHLTDVTLKNATPEPGNSSTFAIFSAKMKDLAGTKQLELKKGKQLVLLPIPDELKPLPRVVLNSPENLTKGTVETVSLQGVNFHALARIEYLGEPQPFTTDPNDPSKIYLSDVNLIKADPGEITVVLVGMSGSTSLWKPKVVKPEKKE